MGIEKPDIVWKGNAPFSRTFNDIYFSPENGVDESRFVFIDGNNLLKRWSSASNFTIFENGFGSGLNFVLTAKLFLETVKDAQTSLSATCPYRYPLNYIAVEKYPLAVEEIERTLTGFDALAEITKDLVRQYPHRTAGFHRMTFACGKINLTLIFEDSIYALKQIETGEKIDAWFLDGFSPSQNPEMWSQEIFHKMARLSGQGTTLATFTAAGHVKRNLEIAGFTVEKKTGFGKKREMITAKYLPDNIKKSGKKATVPASVNHENLKPWMDLPDRRFAKQHGRKRRAAIVGAGLAGCAVAQALARRNFDVEIIDRHNGICGGASGNPLGIFFPVIHRKPTFTTKLSLACYLFFIGHLHNLANEGYAEKINVQQNGLFRLFENETDMLKYVEVLSQNQDYKEIFELDEMNKTAFFREGGFVSPKGLCETNLLRNQKQNAIKTLFSTHIEKIEHENGIWHLFGTDGMQVTESDVLILCASYAIKNFSETNWIPMQKIRGQLMELEIANPSFEIPVSAAVYAIASKNRLVIGATHDFSENESADPGQNMELLAAAKSFLPDMDTMRNKLVYKTGREWIQNAATRVSFRSAAADHFPVIGPVPNAIKYREIFHLLHHGETAYYRKNGHNGQPNAWYPDLYTITGLGSRGILYSQLGAEMIASMIEGEVLPIEKEMVRALSPAR
ncbi:MAG: bifunctional tRNA (5-methylaminomethyl-2-thiouridine)(34)-methyltransferase MnmD/FAD-dependent 5-carboxymethylaminomethyl-2-thiouridine(34) oxidoreductase MnmC, partial [Spirochaetia bacterium]|nr:bifunctional tRNA (5-methylaminomethyl-2-thiouridine)(34)-methyltransferase MnmD/FAD-dependent 5-carboxymethylaminomethyl-2-thiouridine(34) oxidoreductase MnmC [Spirochaetia bacterium]